MGAYDYLKAIFDGTENKTLTFDQFEQAMNGQTNVKLANLSDGNYVSKAKFDTEVDKLKGQVKTLTDTVSQRDADIASVKSQLEQAGSDATKLIEVTNQLSSLQTKYTEDTEKYKAQLAHQSYEFAVKEFANSKQFSSKAAKRDFVQSMLAKNLQMEGDKILGAEDFVTSYATENEDAFVKADDGQQKQEPESQKKPEFVAPTGSNAGNNGGAGDDNPFHFSFVGVRPEPNE